MAVVAALSLGGLPPRPSRMTVVAALSFGGLPLRLSSSDRMIRHRVFW